MINIIINWGIPFLLTSLIAFLSKSIRDLVKNREKDNEHNTAVKSSMLALIRMQLVDKTENHLSLGYLPDSARICINDLYNTYEKLGGNHGISKLVDQCLELPPNDQKYGRRSSDK